MTDSTVYPCPCCGQLVFVEPPGSYEICPVCFWEDDISQLRFPRMGGANHVSLIEGQKNYREYGACEPRVKPHVRPPAENESVESGWRLIDLEIDKIEDPLPGKYYGETYPRDTAILYYWGPTFWRNNAT